MEERSNNRRWVSRPKEAGIEPDTLVDERLRSCKEEREDNSGGKNERFKNVLGREIEMTLF